MLSLVLLAVPSAFAAAPLPPSGLTGYVFDSTTVVLIFNDNSTNETLFRVFFAIGSNTGSVDYPAQSGTGLYFAPVGLSANTTATFDVRAYNADGRSELSPSINITTAPLGAPASLTATAAANGSVLLKFIDNASSELGFRVESRKVGGTFAEIGAVGPNSISPSVPGEDPSSQYEYRVRAYNATMQTAYSNIAAATTPALAAPTSFNATPSVNSPAEVNFTWVDNTTSETAYELEYRKLGSGQAFVRRVAAANTTSASLAEFQPGTAYEFRLRAVRSTTYVSTYATTTATRNGFSSPLYKPGFVNTTLTFQLATTTQSPRTSWSVSNLPGGLTFNSGTGVISGTPNSVGVTKVPIFATFADGTSHSASLEIRVLAPPQVSAPLGLQAVAQGASSAVNLNASFSSLDVQAAVRLATTKGNIDLVLYSNTPQTTQNFLGYVNRGDYNNVIFHRAPIGFVLQGGGYRPVAAPNVFAKVSTVAAVPNEPGISNLTATVAMAKLPDDPNSATSEFFFNLKDNSANLDAQNEGFTVFARVSVPTFSTVTTIAALDRGNYTVTGTNVPTSLTDVPIDLAPAPVTIDQSKLIKINSATSLPVLTYAITANSQPSIATAVIAGSNLQINGLALGTTNLTVTATDVDGSTTSQIIPVEVRQTFAQFASSQITNGAQAGPTDNPDFDLLNNYQEFAFLTDPNVAQTGAAPPSFTLATVGSSQFLEITFPVRKLAVVTYTVEAASTLSPPDWAPLWTSSQGFAMPEVVSAVSLADRTVVTVRDTASSPGSPARFLRVVTK